MSWEDNLRQLGIPIDRIGLVKRNIELKAKLDSAVKVIDSMGQTVHDMFKHPGSWADCARETCSKAKELRDMHKPE